MDTELIHELNRSLGRIEGKQDMILENHTQLRVDHDRLKSKVSEVEKKLHLFSGTIAGVGGLAFVFKERLVHLFWGS